MKTPELLVWAFEKLLRRLGRLNVDGYDAKHRVTPAKMKAALAGRIRDVGIQKAEAPDADADTAQINPGVVQVIASLREWKREEDTKSTPAVIEAPTDVDADDEGHGSAWCGSTHRCDGDEFDYECELNADHGDEHSAVDGFVTWPRTAVLEVAA